MDPVLQTKLAVYKAYNLGRESLSSKTEDDDAKFIHSCLENLSQQPDVKDYLLKKMFYTLILAEIHRLNNPGPFRLSAIEIGEQMHDVGAPNPYPIYMNIIDATTPKLTTGNFGDLKTQAAKTIDDMPLHHVDSWTGIPITYDAVKIAVELSDDEVKNNAKFLGMSLREVAQVHKLIK